MTKNANPWQLHEFGQSPWIDNDGNRAACRDQDDAPTDTAADAATCTGA